MSDLIFNFSKNFCPNLIASLILKLPAGTSDAVKATDLRIDDIVSLGLPEEFVFAKLVELPARFNPELEIHKDAAQLTVVISGQIIWAQGTKVIDQFKLKVGEAILTPANTWHGHATDSCPVILLAAFTSFSPLKDQLKEHDWNA